MNLISSSEVESFTQYLVSRPATNSLKQRYRFALQSLSSSAGAVVSDEPLDSKILRLAAKSPFLTAAMDSACALVRPEASLRTRLYVLAALLETDSDFSSHFIEFKSSLFGVFFRIPYLMMKTVCLFLAGVTIYGFLRVTEW
jgi:hypothetical protein